MNQTIFSVTEVLQSINWNDNLFYPSGAYGYETPDLEELVIKYIDLQDKLRVITGQMEDIEFKIRNLKEQS